MNIENNKIVIERHTFDHIIKFKIQKGKLTLSKILDLEKKLSKIKRRMTNCGS